MDIPADLAGEAYTSVLRRFHDVLQPKTYLEIGVDQGDTLALASCTSIAIDPAFRIGATQHFRQPVLHMFQMTSDDFFAEFLPETILGRKIDMAFLDGMHRCEFLLRDFINTEKSCKKNSVVFMHDCLPVEAAMTDRIAGGNDRMLAPHRVGWWTGDVWRVALLLKRKRPDIHLTALDAVGTGLIVLTRLDPDNTLLRDGYADFVAEMMSWDLDAIGSDRYFAEIGVASTDIVADSASITSRYWI